MEQETNIAQLNNKIRFYEAKIRKIKRIHKSELSDIEFNLNAMLWARDHSNILADLGNMSNEDIIELYSMRDDLQDVSDIDDIMAQKAISCLLRFGNENDLKKCISKINEKMDKTKD